MVLNKKQIIYFILVVIWMIIVFIFSSQPADKSSKTSGGITAKVVKIIVKDPEHMPQSKRDTIETIIRKLAHFILYAIGGFLIANCINTTNTGNSMLIIYSILFATIYAITDEVHQLFVPGRSGELRDVLIDTAGASIGVMIFWMLNRKERNNARKHI